MPPPLHLPKQGMAPFPAVVYLHGGGRSGGNEDAFRRQAAHMATKGSIGATVEYRLSAEARYSAAIDDSMLCAGILGRRLERGGGGGAKS
jgi:acetyl esterase/lipase